MNEQEDIIQKLIDGELSESERYALMHQIDEDSPHLWRDVALGYIEADIIKAVFQSTETNLLKNNQSALRNQSVPRLTTQKLAIAAIALFGLFLAILFSLKNNPSPLSEAQFSQGNEPSWSKQSSKHSGEPNTLHKLTLYDSKTQLHEAQQAYTQSRNSLKAIHQTYQQQGYAPSHIDGYITTPLDKNHEIIIPISFIQIPKNTKQNP